MKENCYDAGETDVIVIGAGHAGIEAAMAASKLGLSVILFTLSNDAVGNMPCNPSIGGSGKGHLVFEIDALGGQMGLAADKVTLQSRTLNLGKGPAVHSKRVQADRGVYRDYMKSLLENQKGLTLRQGRIIDIDFDGRDGSVKGVLTSQRAYWHCRAVIICTGTYLSSRTITGETIELSGPDGMRSAPELSASLARAGIRLMRFKTGTPPRIHSDSIDYSRLELQEGERFILPFSCRTSEDAFENFKQLPCYIAYTNERTHEIIRNNLDKSPLYSGVIEGVGPRYCPSIEDKVVRFADKCRHQLFVEPCGKNTKEMYLQGFSSSLPEEVQLEMLHSISGFEHAVMMRTAYAIEYDCADPTQLYPTLEFKDHPGLYGAGQFNGSSGYEEAAAQGLIAGINAAMKLLSRPSVILPRESSYIGTLIDDLVTKGTAEPYRIMTSRSEYRLLLRQDNARDRLTPIGRAAGLVGDTEYEDFLLYQYQTKEETKRLEDTFILPDSGINDLLCRLGMDPISNKISLADLLRRPHIDYEDLSAFDPDRPKLKRRVISVVQTEIKYEGYIKRQQKEVARRQKLERIPIPPDIDYNKIAGLRIEARQKLSLLRPTSIGQASRISGVSPADISVLIIRLSSRERSRQENKTQ